MSFSRILTAFILFAFPGIVIAQNPKAPDHGRVMACALDVFPHKLKDTTKLSDTKNYVFRGKVISLGKDRRVSICYDVEHMRVAGAWIGKPFVYSSEKNMGPTVEGEMLFATKPGPGWANPRAANRAPGVSRGWDDPRKGKEGPLPRDWVRYKGLYVHGDKVVLSYTVGDMDVLEMPEVVEADVLTQTFNVSATSKPASLLICEDQLLRFSGNGDERKTKPGYHSAAIMFENKKGFGIAGVVGHPSPGAKFEVKQGRLLLNLPAFPKGARFKVFYCRPSDALPVHVIAAAMKNGDEDLKPVIKGGPPRWTQTLETTGTLGDAKGPYALDQITPPTKNPWNASIRFSGLDFFPDGRAALCTWDGDVWIVSALENAGRRPAAKRTWKRFAAGLQQPLGLKIIDGHIYTAGRDQITKLHDLNNDGEADFYENINNDQGLTLQRHEFVMDLQTDKAGNLYFCRSGHYIQSKRGDNCCIYKMSPDGKKLEKFATGFREPNGLSIGPDGTMTVADNEGNGIPQTPIYRLLQGKFYGFTPSIHGNPNQGKFKLTQKPIVWLGPKVDTSAGGQVWAPKTPAADRLRDWGPLAGQLLHTSYGNCALMSVLIDKTAEPWQGAVWRFPLTFNSGIMRARFNPKDGQLYVCGLRGWGTSAVKDGQFARIRYTGKNVPIPVGYRVVKSGLEFTFSAPLDKKATEDDGNWAGTWSGVLKKVPSAKEMQDMPISTITLGADRRTVTIELEKMRTVPNFALQYRIKAADGTNVNGELNGTIHRVP
ncbi:MAG: hypothetical protein HYX68_20765 [Planctomycetes bacterium]|nr:hypothetical protein [Planctomycetota bacterium]